MYVDAFLPCTSGDFAGKRIHWQNAERSRWHDGSLHPEEMVNKSYVVVGLYHLFYCSSIEHDLVSLDAQPWYYSCSSATNRLITAKDHASVQINIGHLDESGVYTGQFTTFALSGFIRAQVCSHFLTFFGITSVIVHATRNICTSCCGQCATILLRKYKFIFTSL